MPSITPPGLGFLAGVVALMLASPAAAQTSTGSFHYVTNLDKITDADRSYIYTTAPQSNDRTPLLFWRCMDDGLNVIYSWDKYFAGDADEEVVVQFRFDRNPPSSEAYWGLMNTNKAAWIPMNMVSPFTEQAFPSGSVVMRVRDSDGETLTDEFPLAGLAEALRRLSCARGLAPTR